MPLDMTKRSKKSIERSSDARFLDNLIELFNVPIKKYNKGEIVNSSLSKVHFDNEAKLLKQFWLKFKSIRSFTPSKDADRFRQIFRGLVKVCLLNSIWKQEAPPENIFRLFQCLRILLRDNYFQSEFDENNGLVVINEYLQVYSEKHIQFSEGLSTDILKEIINICQKFSVDQSSKILSLGMHQSLVLLLSSTDVSVLHLSIYVLLALTKSEDAREAISGMNCVEVLIQIIGEYDELSKQLAVNLVRQLCSEQNTREQIKVFNGIPILLSLLRCDSLKLLWNVVWILVQLSEDSDISNEVRLLGGIPMLIALLQDPFSQEEDSLSVGSTVNADVTIEQKHSLQAAVCAALTELVLNDTNARCVVQANGIYIIMMLIFPRPSDHNGMTNSCLSDHNGTISSGEEQLQKNAFRTLRFLFSMERNRQLFKRMFPAGLFEKFIDVGHYQRDLNSYNGLVSYVNQLTPLEYQEIRERIQTTNLNKAPSSYIQSYAVCEHLGTGAFGSVYKVKRKGGQSYLAMKQISVRHPEFGKGKERSENIDSLINECSFVKKQLNHPNIVKYHKAFLEGEKLYIIMDLIDGAPLGEHFNSLKEKGQRFSEERLWNIFVQMVLALRYIHKEKFIVHRDLTPNNIMLGEDDHVTITDFGLARQKNTDASKLTSMVGTIVYSCPEIVKGLPYGEKADIWGIGCILYQMAMLEPPFFSNNMLSMATKIVEGQYEPLKDGIYSAMVSLVIQRCLTVPAEERPDILEVASMIPDLLIQHIEKLRNQNSNIVKKFEKERKRVQKQTDHFKNHRQVYNEIFSDKVVESVNTSLNETNLLNKQTLGSRPLLIKNFQKTEQTSSSGSWESMDEDAFLKQSTSLQKSKLLPLEHLSISSSRRSSTSVSQVFNTTAASDLIKRTNSCSYLDNIKSVNEKTSQKFRPTSAQTTLSISPRKVREINDPILMILSQLHKILFISQLPPSLKFDPNRRIIDQYKRSLFTAPSSAANLKNELKKLMEGSKEHVDNFFPDFSSLQPSSEKMYDNVTYEDLQSILENSLLENGYYNITSSRVKPLGPISPYLSNSAPDTRTSLRAVEFF